MRGVLCVSLYKSGNVCLPFGRGRSVCVLSECTEHKTSPSFHLTLCFCRWVVSPGRGQNKWESEWFVEDNFQVFGRWKCTENKTFFSFSFSFYSSPFAHHSYMIYTHIHIHKQYVKATLLLKSAPSVSCNHSAVAADVHSNFPFWDIFYHSYQLYFFPVTAPMSAGGQDYCCLQVVSEWLCLWDECHHNAVIASGFFWKLWHSEFRVCQFKNSGGSKLVLVMLAVLMYLWLYLFCIFMYCSWRVESQKLVGENWRRCVIPLIW